jgi:hypothetical protein
MPNAQLSRKWCPELAKIHSNAVFLYQPNEIAISRTEAGHLAQDVVIKPDPVMIPDPATGGKAAFPVADALADRHIPFVFATGYLVAGHIPARHADVRRFEKPTAPGVIYRALEEAMDEASD